MSRPVAEPAWCAGPAISLRWLSPTNLAELRFTAWLFQASEAEKVSARQQNVYFGMRRIRTLCFGGRLIGLTFSRPRIQIADGTDAANPFATVGLWPKLASEIGNVKINASIEWRKFPIQDTFHQLVSCQHLARKFEKHVQQLKFGRSQIQRPAGFRDGPRTQIEFQVSKRDFGRPKPVLVVRLPARSPENGGDARDQFTRAEWLWQVVVGAKLQPEDAVKLFAPGSQHQDRSPHALPNIFENVKSLLVRQHDVQHD